MSKAVLESVKELARLAFFACVTAAIGWATAKLNVLDPTSTQYLLGVAILRAVDSWVHHTKKTSLTSLSPTDFVANKLAE